MYVLQIWGKLMLQVGAFFIIKNWATAVTNQGSCYKLGLLLLQNTAAITNWGKIYYKLGQNIQIRVIITN